MQRVSLVLCIIGAISLLGAAGINALAVGSGSPAALAFSSDWWTRWFPIYGCAASMLVIGLALRWYA